MWIALGLVGLGCSSPSTGSAEGPPVAPTPRKVITIPVTPEVLPARLFSKQPRPRLFNVWATWCAPCREEMPRLKAWAQRHPEVDVVLVNVDPPRLLKGKVEPFILEQGLEELTHWQLEAPDPAVVLGRIVPDWNYSLPTTLLIDTSGQIERQFDRMLTENDLASLP